MFIDAIPGLNKMFSNDPPEGSVILVTGTSGSLKSSLIFTLMCSHLTKASDETGIYVTLEETRESHLRNMKSIGIKYSENLSIYDIASFKSDMGYDDMTSYIHPKDYVDLVLRGLFNVIKRQSATIPKQGNLPSKEHHCCYALDSLNALQDLAKIDPSVLRQKIQELFHTLRGSRGLNFIIYEKTTDTDMPEYYLADGIIELGTIKGPAGVKRFIQVRKMKATKHSLDPFVIDVAKGGGLVVVGPLMGQK